MAHGGDDFRIAETGISPFRVSGMLDDLIGIPSAISVGVFRHILGQDNCVQRSSHTKGKVEIFSFGKGIDFPAEREDDVFGGRRGCAAQKLVHGNIELSCNVRQQLDVRAALGGFPLGYGLVGDSQSGCQLFLGQSLLFS